MKKKGLSNLVATVLIVLLALAAVALIWGFLKPAFDRTGVQIDLRTKCIGTEAKPTKCVIGSGNIATVTVQSISGEFSEVYVVVEADDSTANATKITAPPLLATVNVVVAPQTSGSEPARAKVATVVSDEQGNTEVCQESPATVDCESA